MGLTSLKCGILPGESTAVVMRLNEPLRAYLEKCLRMPVQLIVGSNYAETGDSLRSGHIDIAYLGPVAYILQSRFAPLEPFARPSHPDVGPTFQAAIIVPQDSPANTLADLKGREVALGDMASTSGSWVPRYQLFEEGLVADRDYTRRNLGAHDAVAVAVVNRQVAAGGISLPVFLRLIRDEKIDPAKVRILAVSKPIPEYMWTFRAALHPALRDEIRNAFINLTDPAALGVFRADFFIPAVDPDVDRVRHWMEAILQTKLKPSSLPWPPAQSEIYMRPSVHENSLMD